MSKYIKAWQELMIEPYPWALFSNGTIVILTVPVGNPAEYSINLLKSLLGKSGSELGDFGVQKLEMDKGWIITSQHPDIVTLVSFDEVPEEDRDDTLSIGFHGRLKRKLDAESCRVIHIEAERMH